jgi:hypothetical protein
VCTSSTAASTVDTFPVRLKATAASSLRKCPRGRDVELGEELLRVGRREDGFAAGRLAASMRLTGVRKSGRKQKTTCVDKTGFSRGARLALH